MVRSRIGQNLFPYAVRGTVGRTQNKSHAVPDCFPSAVSETDEPHAPDKADRM